MFCPKCGKEVSGSPTFCPSCGGRLAESQPAKKTRLSTVAGILDIVSGGFGFVSAFFVIIMIILMATDPYLPESDEADFMVFILAITVPMAIVQILAGILAIVGGMYALRRKKWGIALTGAIAAVVAFSLMGIAAVVLTALSRDEFE
ncbi:MAG: hypothetical protein A2Y72_05500 [Chloroflexi bacterium RBG_13_53_26]|jgi:uncharacterized BrkB/YihY/UPF0761 family membrane protein|nr:MAG: hypothetical protein A2Y72_05500 [Chloroflexi bacterium RBG_13_53_26]